MRSETIDRSRSRPVDLTAALLEAVAEQPRPPRVVLIGSAAEYGHVPASALPVREDWPCRPASDYAASKHRQTLLGLMREAGFEDARYHNLTGGIVAVHRGFKY